MDAPLGLPADEAWSSVARNRAEVCSEDEADAWEVNGLAPDPWAALLEGEGPEVNRLAPDPWAALLEGEGPEVNALGLAPEEEEEEEEEEELSLSARAWGCWMSDSLWVGPPVSRAP